VFTGIIESIGAIRRIEQTGGGRRLSVSAPYAVELAVDQSVAVNGVCLTVTALDAGAFDADVVEETLTKTNLGLLETGDRVNLERAMQLGDRLDGHLVQGHVDATGEIIGVEALEASHMIHVAFPGSLDRYLIPVGSITVDGVSLTVARLEGNTFSVAIIPHTWERTTLSERRLGDRVNLEFDVVGKYVVRALERGVAHGEALRRFVTG